MASDEGNFPGPRCKNANISIERLTDGDVRKLSCDDFTKGILYELNRGVRHYSELRTRFGISNIIPVIS